MLNLKEMSFKNIGLIIIGVMLLFGILELPYNYYRLLRLCVTIVSILILIYDLSKSLPNIFLIISTILFNPIIPFYLKKNIWTKIDLIFGAVYIFISLHNHFTEISPNANK